MNWDEYGKRLDTLAQRGLTSGIVGDLWAIGPDEGERFLVDLEGVGDNHLRSLSSLYRQRQASADAVSDAAAGRLYGES